MKTVYADLAMETSQTIQSPKLAAVLAIMVTSYLMRVSAATTTRTSSDAEHLAHRIANTFNASTIMLLISLVVVVVFLARRRAP